MRSHAVELGIRTEPGKRADDRGEMPIAPIRREHVARASADWLPCNEVHKTANGFEAILWASADKLRKNHATELQTASRAAGKALAGQKEVELMRRSSEC